MVGPVRAHWLVASFSTAVQRRALSENERLTAETRLLKERLRSALAVVEDGEDTLYGIEPHTREELAAPEAA